MLLSVYLSNSEQHISEVPITPETLGRDVLELCRHVGEGECYLAETWGGAERVVDDSERMLELLRRRSHERGEVRYLLRHQRPPNQSGETTAEDHVTRRNPAKDKNLEERLRSLKGHGLHPQESDQQDVSDLQRLRQLQENAQNQEARLRRVRALKGQVEHKRRHNNKLVEEVELVQSLLQQKQQELAAASMRAEELSNQLEALRGSRGVEPRHLLQKSCHSSTSELELLCRQLKLRNQLNLDQNRWLLQRREALNNRNLEAAATERRLADLRLRLWRKKAGLQQKENVPVSGGSRVAAVGPYMQSSQGPPLPPRQEVLTKPAYFDGTFTLPMPDSSLKQPPRPAKTSRPAEGYNVHKSTEWSSSFSRSGSGLSHASTLPRMTRLCGRNSGVQTPKEQEDVLKFDAPPPLPSRASSEARLTGEQDSTVAPPPLPRKQSSSRPPYSTGTFPGRLRSGPGLPRTVGGVNSTLPLKNKQEPPPAVAVYPFTPEPSDSFATLPKKPQTLTTSSIYSMYTQQGPGSRSAQPSQGGQTSRQPVYGKPVFSSVEHPSPVVGLSESEEVHSVDGYFGDSVDPEFDRCSTPRLLSPTKLLPFQSHLLRSSSDDASGEAHWRKIHCHAPRPLKKRNSISEPEPPGSPNIQKLLYQKTTLAAMETVAAGNCQSIIAEDEGSNDQLCARTSEERLTPPPLPPRSPKPMSPEQGPSQPSSHPPEYRSYPPPPYPESVEVEPQRRTRSPTPPKTSERNSSAEVPTSILHKPDSSRHRPRLKVRFNPLALLLDASLEGEYDLVQRVIYDVEDPSAPNDEGITPLHNGVCAGHANIVHFLVQFGVNVNAADSDGWTPLHCAASCNNLPLCRFLVESGAAVFATTHSDLQTAALKCEEQEEGYAACSQFLQGVEEKIGLMNRGVVYALWDYEPQANDELGVAEGDLLTVLRRDDGVETEWWWARCGDREGYVPRNLLGLSPRVRPRQRSLA
ncbi:apoptosis-stimulating of p53 protein 2-like [Neosynchiropus ocellatus]